jgi:hypothetical protein
VSWPSWLKYVRDVVIFSVGVGIVVGQTGFPYLVDAPASGPSIPALVVGALFCNGPVMLQALALRFGGGSPSEQAPPPQPALPSAPSSESSSGGS